MKKIACLGEFLLRMSPQLPTTWIQEASIPVYLGGAEFNVAAALSAWKNQVKYISALPENSMANAILMEIEQMGIDASAIQRSGDRIGIYFLPQGADLKNAGVIYDRAGSSFAGMQPGTIDWNTLLKDCDFFHFSAISPALNETSAAICLEAVQAAAALGLTISVDLNYRSKLWKYGKAPQDLMPALVHYCHLVMGNIWSANSLLGAPLDNKKIAAGTKQAYLEQATETAAYIRQLAPSCKWVANTFRFDQPQGIDYYASLDTVDEQAVSARWSIDQIVDRVGSGDCFMAGLIHGWINDWKPETTLNLAAAAAVGKLQEKGDFTRQTLASIHQKIAEHG